MKPHHIPIALAAVFFVFFGGLAQAALVFEQTGLGISIPDNSAQGILRTIQVSGVDDSLTYAPRVSLRIVGTGFGGFIGDLYGYLSHGTSGGDYRMAVLLNRPGRTALEPSGYDEDGLDVVFADDATGDIHSYRDSNPSIVSGTLLGNWQPDARTASPFEVEETSPRTSFLAPLGAIDPNGTWNLFLADLEAGGTMRLESWGLELIPLPIPIPSSASVPEPSQFLSMALLICLAGTLAAARGAIRRKQAVSSIGALRK
jgi:hypothetical protein